MEDKGGEAQMLLPQLAHSLSGLPDKILLPKLTRESWLQLPWSPDLV